MWAPKVYGYGRTEGEWLWPQKGLVMAEQKVVM